MIGVRAGWDYFTTPQIDPVTPNIIYPEQKILLGIPININEADSEELQALPGIGPSLAKRIVDYRETHSTFQSLNDLTKVHGIGPKTIEALRPLVSLAPVK